MPNKHARLSPSGAHKWMLCPASLAAERGIREQSSIHAAEGTAAHSVAESVLRAINPAWVNTRPVFSKLVAKDYIGEVIEGWTITEDMAPPIQAYIDTVLAEANGKTLHVEQRVDFSHVVGVRNSFGTADAIIVHGDELQIHDLKFGRGVRVDAQNNYQLMIYALGALPIFELGQNINTIKLFIHQPRLNHVSEWEISTNDLLAWGKEVKKAAKRAIDLYKRACDPAGGEPRAEDFNPGEKQCRWCKASGTCKAQAQFVYEQVAAEFVDLDAAEFDACNPNTLNPEQLAQAHANLDFIESWCDKVRKAVYQRLLAGGGLPGLKLVQGRPGNRKWSSIEAAEDVLGRIASESDIYRQTLITPTQAEKLLKDSPDEWDALQAVIERPAGAPVVVSETDPRPAISAADEFNVIG